MIEIFRVFFVFRGHASLFVPTVSRRTPEHLISGLTVSSVSRCLRGDQGAYTSLRDGASGRKTACGPERRAVPSAP